MYEQVEKPKENKNRAVANSVTQKKSHGGQGFGFEDNRPEAITQRKLIEIKGYIPFQTKDSNDSIITVQRMGYDQINGSTIHSELKEEEGKISFTGAVRVDAQNTSVINASLTYDVVALPLANVQSGLGLWDRNFKKTNALNLKTLDASPRGRKIGQILTYHLGEKAKSDGVPYVLAGSVSDARGPFYTPLGFKDMLNAPPWADLVQEKTELEDQMRTEITEKQMKTITKRYNEIINLMDKNQIYITASDLASNSKSKWETLWKQT